MASYRSSEEFLEAVRDLMTRLEHRGHHQAAAELLEGFRCLNGLTDGWALFLESIGRIQAAAKRFDPDDQRALEDIRAAAHAAVYWR